MGRAAGSPLPSPSRLRVATLLFHSFPHGAGELINLLRGRFAVVVFAEVVRQWLPNQSGELLMPVIREPLRELLLGRLPRVARMS